MGEKEQQNKENEEQEKGGGAADDYVIDPVEQHLALQKNVRSTNMLYSPDIDTCYEDFGYNRNMVLNLPRHSACLFGSIQGVWFPSKSISKWRKKNTY